MILKRAGSQPSQKGPDACFTGTVRIDPLHAAEAPARVAAAAVTFEPGARSAWHTHPLGQILVVTAGCGWTQCEGGRSQKSAPATSSGVRPITSIGTAPRPPPP